MAKRTKTKPKPKTLGHNVRKTRKQQKFTVEQLARKVNMRVNYIEDIENDVITQVPADILFRIANALSTTIADLAELPVRVRQEGCL